MKKILSFIFLCALSFTSVFSMAGFLDANLNHWMLRFRIINLDPDPKSSTITTIGGKVDYIDNAIAPELDLNYFLTKNISLELILATTKHNVEAKGTLLDINGKAKLGSVRLLPPTLLAQYHFLPNTKVDPYLGAGLNYTLFYSQKEHSSLTDIDYKNSFGPAIQAGLDVMLQDNWTLNFDVKKVYVESDVTVTAGEAKVKTKVNLDPIVYGIGLGYHFT